MQNAPPHHDKSNREGEDSAVNANNPNYQKVASVSAPASTPIRLMLFVVIPFGVGYFLSFLFRNTNAVLAPELIQTFDLDATELGVLTAVFFGAAALQYVPLALLLDRFGPKRIFFGQAVITVIACLMTAWAESFAMLVAARALLGIGVAACLTTAFKAVTVWFPRDRLATGNGLILFSGALGAVTSTRPLQMFLITYDWRDMFLLAAFVSIALALYVALVMPERNSERVADGRSSLAVYREILTHPIFWRVSPAAAFGLAGFFAIQGLWANGWMSDVAGLDQAAIGHRLLAIALAMIAGTLINGMMIDALAKRGIDRSAYLAVGLGGLLFAEIALATKLDPQAYWPWILMGFTGNVGALVHSILNRIYPAHYAARSISTIAVLTFALVFVIQSGIGFILDIWGVGPDGSYPEIAYYVAFGILVFAQGSCLLYLVVSLGRLRIEARKAG